ncbi:MAG: hypothetical protein JWP65_2140 [Ramlibacter sp.]|jgi:hypothetical protein|nr:hypothetical protein [Ramlibacter sp.]MDB5751719.1 hypothetical protein [Ramlibacter sp.]
MAAYAFFSVVNTTLASFDSNTDTVTLPPGYPATGLSFRAVDGGTLVS